MLPVLITSLCMGFALQGCNATTSDVKQGMGSKKISSKTTSALFNNGVNVYLDDIIQGFKMVATKDNKIIKKPLSVVRAVFLRSAILNSKKGKHVGDCQFIAMRVETDGEIDTTEWLTTTQEQGSCKTKGGNVPRNFWIIQQSKSSPVKVLLEGRASHVSVYKPDKSQQSKVSIRSSAQIRVKNGDQLTDGSWVQVNSPDNKNVEINCNYHYQLQNGVYVVTDKSVEVSVPTGSMLNSHTPEMFWQPIDDPRYQCAF